MWRKCLPLPFRYSKTNLCSIYNAPAATSQSVAAVQQEVSGGGSQGWSSRSCVVVGVCPSFKGEPYFVSDKQKPFRHLELNQTVYMCCVGGMQPLACWIFIFFVWTYIGYKISLSAGSIGVLCAETVVSDKVLQAVYMHWLWWWFHKQYLAYLSIRIDISNLNIQCLTQVYGWPKLSAPFYLISTHCEIVFRWLPHNVAEMSHCQN